MQRQIIFLYERTNVQNLKNKFEFFMYLTRYLELFWAWQMLYLNPLLLFFLITFVLLTVTKLNLLCYSIRGKWVQTGRVLTNMSPKRQKTSKANIFTWKDILVVFAPVVQQSKWFIFGFQFFDVTHVLNLDESAD